MSATFLRPPRRHDIPQRGSTRLKRILKRALLLALLVSSLGFSGPANAQDADSEPLTGAPAPVTAGEAITDSVAVPETVEGDADAEASESEEAGSADSAGDQAQGQVATRTYPVMSSKELWPFAILLLGFALLLNLMLINYFTHAQSQYFETVQKLITSGRALPDSHSVASFEKTVGAQSQIPRAGASKDDEPDDAPPLEAEGPTVVTVGVAASYTVDREAEWSVEPADAAVFDRQKGESVELTAATAGEFTITVKDGAAEATLAVTANEAVEDSDDAAAAEGGSLPFVGEGVGTVTIAVLLVVAVVILAFRGIMTSDAVATFLGGLLGYIFGVRKSE